jgi:hypothetical protein
MRPEIKQRWIAALRSGKYQQAKSYLNFNGRFCCLGVLCDVVKEDVGGKWAQVEEAPPASMFVVDDVMETGVLPPAVLKFAGLHHNPEVRTSNGHLKMLSQLNDNDGLSFSEIADLIEEQL